DVFRDNVIVGSGGAGLSVQAFVMNTSSGGRGGVSLLGGRIEGSRGPGLEFQWDYWFSPVMEARPIRITGGATVAVSGPIGAWRTIWPTAADQDSLRGDGAETIAVWGGLEGEGLVVPSGFVLDIVSHIFAAPNPGGAIF